MDFKLKYERDGTLYHQENLKKVAGGGRSGFEAEGIAVEHEVRQYESGLMEYRLLVKNTGCSPLDITSALPYAEKLAIAGCEMQYFTSDWSREYGLVTEVVKPLILQNETGRSSKGYYPQIFFKEGDKYRIAIVVAWSGNWKINVEQNQQEYMVSAGITDVDFRKTLQPGEVFDSFRVLVAQTEEGTLDEITRAFTLWHRKFNSPKSEEAYSIPVEWNQWWPYEDAGVNEEMFKANSDAAKELGCEICVLDAGWFGQGDSWYEVRGDWEKVNEERFPSGIRALSDYVHLKGMKFGIWCEIEALGSQSELGKRHPEFEALREEQHLRYLCLGSEAAWHWAFSTLEGLIVDYNVDWIKVDFNLDPGKGCNRTDHGHNAGDGLYEHYRGLYKLADTVRAKYPHVILEACSSGGLRIDHEILHHFDFHFLSDNDETVNKMKFYHHNLTVLPPEACLSWAWSDTKINEDGKSAFPPFTPWDPKYAAYELDTHIRIGMLGVFGLSHRLVLFNQEIKDVFLRNIEFYKQYVREFIKKGVVLKLAPREFIEDIDLYAVQYYLEEQGSSLIFIFNKSEKHVTINLKSLCLQKIYTVCIVDTYVQLKKTGRELMEEGLKLGVLRGWESRVVRIFEEGRGI
jgi:alpha-galactosidase